MSVLQIQVWARDKHDVNPSISPSPVKNPVSIGNVRGWVPDISDHRVIQPPLPWREGLGEGENKIMNRLTNFAKSLRKNSTYVETILWNKLRSDKLKA
jgi:hypothetical protein